MLFKCCGAWLRHSIMSYGYHEVWLGIGSCFGGRLEVVHLWISIRGYNAASTFCNFSHAHFKFLFRPMPIAANHQPLITRHVTVALTTSGTLIAASAKHRLVNLPSIASFKQDAGRLPHPSAAPRLDYLRQAMVCIRQPLFWALLPILLS